MRAQVLLPKVFNFSFTYNTKKKFKLGDLVEVPFGNRRETGVIWPGKGYNLKKSKSKIFIKK